MNEVIAKYDRMAQQSGEAHARLIAPELINEIKRLEKRVAELEAGLKASEEKMRLHAGDCCSLNNEVELFRSQRDDAHDELIIVKHRLAELNMAASKIVLMFDGPDDFNIEPKHIEDIREALSPKDGD